MFNIRLTNDFAFKRIFGQEDTKDILAAFLTDVLGFDVSDDIELENTEISPEYVRDKASRLDITARIGGKEKINVEIQLINEHNIDKRAGDKETMERIAEKKPILRRAITIAEMMEQDKHQRWLYEMREKGLKDIRSIESYAREEGREEGIEQGERLGKLETARKMLSRGMDIALIIDLTGLSEDEIKSL